MGKLTHTTWRNGDQYIKVLTVNPTATRKGNHISAMISILTETGFLI